MEAGMTTSRIQVNISGFFTTHHRFLSEGGELGQLTLAATRRGGVFRSFDGRELVLRQKSLWRSEHELHEGGLVLASARPRGFFRTAILIEFGGQTYTLERISFWKRGWRLLDPGNVAVMEIQPQGLFKRGAFLDILGEIDANLLVFAYYLIYMRWQEEAAAAS
jgi:hypothetical protein